MSGVPPDTDEAREDLQFIIDQSWPSSGIPAACDRIRSALERLVTEVKAVTTSRDYLIERCEAAEEKVAWNAEHISEVVVLERERRVAAEVRAEQLEAALKVIADEVAINWKMPALQRVELMAEIARAAVAGDPDA